MEQKNRWQAPGSFTVEAALLMGIILPVLIALLLMGFYLHDKACLQGTASELCARGSSLRLYKDREGTLAKIRDKRLSHSLLWTRDVSGGVTAGTDEMSASAEGSFPVPGLIAALTGNKLSTVGAKWQARLHDPTDLIWKIRGAKYLLDEVLH